MPKGNLLRYVASGEFEGNKQMDATVVLKCWVASRNIHGYWGMLDLTLSPAGCDALHLQAGYTSNPLYECWETTCIRTDEHQERVGCNLLKLIMRDQERRLLAGLPWDASTCYTRRRKPMKPCNDIVMIYIYICMCQENAHNVHTISYKLSYNYKHRHMIICTDALIQA